ncbi:MAG: trans-sulfuration enzyme family protein [Bacillota bacterium]
MKKMSKAYITGHYMDAEYRSRGGVIPPIAMNSLFLFEDADAATEAFKAPYENYIYTRGLNPTNELFEKKMAKLENAEACRAFSSGMAAISSAIMSCIKQGEHIVTINTVYGPARDFMTVYLKKFGVECTMVDGRDPLDFVNAAKENTALFYLESPSSYLLRIQDLKRIADFAKERGIKTIVDNSWATPIFQTPLDYGIDMVVHSATKYISGHSDVVAGVVAGSREQVGAISLSEHALFGGVLSPFDAWLLTRGLRTLHVRMKYIQESAMKIAAFLEKHSRIKYVIYPGLKSYGQHELAKEQMSGFSGVMTFCVDSYASAKKVIDSLQLFGIGVSWGGFESLVFAPGIPMGEENIKEQIKNTQFDEGMIRISIGLEDPDELIEDLNNALSIM